MLKPTISNTVKMTKEREIAEERRGSTSLESIKESFFVLPRVNEAACKLGIFELGWIL